MDQSGTINYNTFQNIICNRSGRNGISVSAGRYIKFLDCHIDETGQGINAQAPVTGIDIEPDDGIPPNEPLDACSQILIENCTVKNSFGNAFTILSIAPDPGDSWFIPQHIYSKNSSYYDYDDNAPLSLDATVQSTGMYVTFEGGTIVGSFWRGCHALSSTDHPTFINVTFLENDGQAPQGVNQYQQYNRLFYSDNLCENMFFDQCTFSVQKSKSPMYMHVKDVTDTLRYTLFRDCNFIYGPDHVESPNTSSVFVGCKFQGQTTFTNLSTNPSTWAKNIRSAGTILNGSLDPCQPSQFKLDKALIFTYNYSHNCNPVNQPLYIGPKTNVSGSLVPTYANIEFPDNSSFLTSIYENYTGSGGCMAALPPLISIGSKSRFLMYGSSANSAPLFLANQVNSSTPSFLIENDGQLILGPHTQIALNSASALNPIGNSNTFYFDPNIIHPWYYPNSSISMGAIAPMA